MYGLRHAIHSTFKGAVESVMPVSTTSQFEDKRLLTPEEFVKAGDYLVTTVGSWSWSGGEEKKRVNYLPADKQFLVTRGVPCRCRASTLFDGPDEMDADGDGQWICAGKANRSAAEADTITDISDKPADATPAVDLDKLDINDAEDEDEYQPQGSGAADVENRTYDLYITYSKYYQVPQFWLVGFSANNLPLKTKAMLEDMSAEHADKTVTVDPFPHMSSLKTASIHPCKHANVMKVLGDQQLENGKPFPVEHYLILFLKFIASVVPTIEYDYSMASGEQVESGGNESLVM